MVKSAVSATHPSNLAHVQAPHKRKARRRPIFLVANHITEQGLATRHFRKALVVTRNSGQIGSASPPVDCALYIVDKAAIRHTTDCARGEKGQENC